MDMPAEQQKLSVLDTDRRPRQVRILMNTRGCKRFGCQSSKPAYAQRSARDTAAQ